MRRLARRNRIGCGDKQCTKRFKRMLDQFLKSAGNCFPQRRLS